MESSSADSSAGDASVASPNVTDTKDAPEPSDPVSQTDSSVDQPPAVDMKEDDDAMDGAPTAPPETNATLAAQDDQPLPQDAPSPTPSSPLSAPTPPQAASPPPRLAPVYDLPLIVETAISTKDFDSFLLRLEDIELESVGDVTPADVYACMIAANLILNDVVNAKLLWKRIPDSTKQEAPELERLWRVGKHFWSSDYKAVFDELDKEEWSQLMQPLTKCLVDSVRQRVLVLIEKSYESLHLSSLTSLLGLHTEEAQLALASDRRWHIAQGFAFPSKRDSADGISGRGVSHDEEALRRLTDYVAFLEE